MTDPPQPYSRLTRNSAGLGTYSSLWLGADHVMIVRSTGYHESYVRLQLRDMKAIFLTATARRMWWAIGWGGLALLGGVFLAVNLAGHSLPIFSPFFLVVGLAGAIWNHALGAGCRAHVLTGVQTAELPSLVRMKKARRVLARLQPLIAAAQAEVAKAPSAAPVVSMPAAVGAVTAGAEASAAPPTAG